MARILLIDDDAIAREILKTLFEDVGYEVQEAADGLQGTNLFRENPADLVITDIVMPQKEGIETIMDLRREFPAVKIIAISGGGERLTRESCLQAAELAGARRTFAKPINVLDLLNAMSELLTGP